jgi:hypothetical protein
MSNTLCEIVEETVYMSETLDVGCGKRKQGTVNIDLDRKLHA